MSFVSLRCLIKSLAVSFWRFSSRWCRWVSSCRTGPARGKWSAPCPADRRTWISTGTACPGPWPRTASLQWSVTENFGCNHRSRVDTAPGPLPPPFRFSFFFRMGSKTRVVILESIQIFFFFSHFNKQNVSTCCVINKFPGGGGYLATLPIIQIRPRRRRRAGTPNNWTDTTADF